MQGEVCAAARSTRLPKDQELAATRAQTGEWPGVAAVTSRTGSRIQRVRGWLLRMLLAAIGWTAAGCLFALPSLATKGWHDELRIYLAQFWGWGVLAPIILAIDRRLPFSGKDLKQRVMVHFGLSLAFTEIYFFIFTAMRAAMGVTPWSSLSFGQLFSPSVLGWQIWSWLIYWVIAGAIQAYGYYQRYVGSELRLEKLEHSFAEARLNSLRMQLDPHFLFNALNT